MVNTMVIMSIQSGILLYWSTSTRPSGALDRYYSPYSLYYTQNTGAYRCTHILPAVYTKGTKDDKLKIDPASHAYSSY